MPARGTTLVSPDVTDLQAAEEAEAARTGAVTVFDPFDSINPEAHEPAGSAAAQAVAAQTPEEEARLTRPGTPVGTPRYMSPEQVLGWQVDQRSDLYSFGCIFYEMLAGRSPYDGPNSRAYMNQHLHEPPRPLRDVAPEVPEPVAALVERLLAKSPSDRFANWSVLRDELRGLRSRMAAAAALASLEGDDDDDGDDFLDDEIFEITQEVQLISEPYRFLDAFTRASRHLFFGRDGDAERFLSMWRHPDQPPLLILTGASGVGKTSFLRARVIPSLEDINVQVMRIVGGEDPARQLDAALRRELVRATSHSMSRLGGERGPLPSPDAPTAQVLDAYIALMDRPVAIVLDQLEEVFTAGQPEAAARLQAELASMVAGGGGEARFILSLREDYLGELLRTLHPLPTDTLTRTLPLRPLEAGDLEAALRGPSRPNVPVAYRPFRFEDGLVSEIVSDLLSDPAGEVAPRVQAVGARLWEMVRRDEAPVITRRHYRDRLGGARGILARVLDEAILDLDASDQGVAKELLRALTHLPGSPTSRPAQESQLTAHADQDRRERVLRRLEDRWRVIQGYTDPRWPEERTFRITHEALIDRIQQYGEEGEDRNRARQLFRHGLSLWLRGGRRPGDLLTEHHFDEVQHHIEDLVLRTDEERAFYEACLEAHNQGWLERLEESRSRQRQQFLLGTLVPVLFVTVGLLIGQAPVGFVTLRTAMIRGMIALSLPSPDLTGATLRGADLGMASLRGATLREADLREALLLRADLEGADLGRARLEEANLTRADLRGAELTGASLRGARLDGADLRKATLGAREEWAEASFVGAIFSLETRWGEGEVPEPPRGAVGPWGDIGEMSLPNISLAGLDLFKLSAAGATLSGAKLMGTELIDADLSGADLSGADLSRARLERSRLPGANLQGAEMAGVSALGVDMRGANLEGASLRAAELSGADLREARLCGADLSDARLARVKLTGAETCEGTVWPWGFAVPDDVVAGTP